MTGALTTFARPDGKMQVAINGLPLYYYAGDTKAGDTTGQGKTGKWFVASPTGTAPGGLRGTRPRAAPTADPRTDRRADHRQNRTAPASRGPFHVRDRVSSRA